MPGLNLREQLDLYLIDTNDVSYSDEYREPVVTDWRLLRMGLRTVFDGLLPVGVEYVTQPGNAATL